MLIDDNDDFVTLIEFYLKRDTDWQIFTAKNGKLGIAKAIKEQPDLILIDLAMPELDGIGVYQILQLEKATRSIPAIFLTAMVGVEKMVSSKVGEDVEVFTKPMELTIFKEKINDLYDRYLPNF